MKIWWLAGILVTLSALTISAQPLYTVQVGTFKDVRSQDFDPMRDFGFVYANQLEGNLAQVYLGDFGNKAEADRLATILRAQGYNNALVMERPLDRGRQVTVIQLATRHLDKDIDWEALDRVGNLFAIVDGKTVKIVTGIYADGEAAKKSLATIHKAGYGDAFVKAVNDQTLIRITPFESGLKKPLIPITLTERPPVTATPTPAPPARTPAATTQPPVAATTQPEQVASYNQTEGRLTARSADTAPPTSTAAALSAPAPPVAQPTIRGNVKRRSALDLQAALKAEGYYQGSLDGYYGPNTSKAYQQALNEMPELRKYRVLAANLPRTDVETTNRVQRAINDLPTDPAAAAVINGASEPIAKGYRAYQLYTTRGAGTEVNNLMNTAINDAYRGKKLSGRPPFDPNATYAYQDLNQLILHLHYIHAAPGIDYTVPCWLYERHPREANEAQAAMANFAGAELKFQGCDPFLQWDEVQLLRTIASDLSAGRVEKAMLTETAARRAQLYLTREPLSTSSARAADAWHQELWKNVTTWGDSDPLHEEIVQALRIAYHQSQVRLEDYFMNRGFPADQAKELALATLQSLIGVQLARFI